MLVNWTSRVLTMPARTEDKARLSLNNGDWFVQSRIYGGSSGPDPCPFCERNKLSALFHIKIFIPRSKSKNHKFCRIFNAGKSISANLRYPIFKFFRGACPHTPLRSLDLWQKLKVPSFKSETPALYKS